MSVPDITLNNGTKVPQLGFGTWLIKDAETCKNAVRAALEAGYRHLDTAQIYGNEAFVGQAGKESGVPREQVFITTKVWNENLFWDDVIPSVEQSLKNLQTDYVDLLLIHFPVTELRRPAWRRMEDLLAMGKTKAIGVSNYTVKHLEELLRECKVKPAVNQVELHVFLQQPELVEFCRENDIAVEAYSPLAHGYIVQHDVLDRIAQKHGKTMQQVMIRWCLQQGFITLPKSTHPDRIKQNFEVFDFELDQQEIDMLKDFDSGLRTCWDPTNVV